MRILFCEKCIKVYACLGKRVYSCETCFASADCIYRKKILIDFPSSKFDAAVNGFCVNCINKGGDI